MWLMSKEEQTEKSMASFQRILKEQESCFFSFVQDVSSSTMNRSEKKKTPTFCRCLSSVSNQRSSLLAGKTSSICESHLTDLDRLPANRAFQYECLTGGRQQ